MGGQRELKTGTRVRLLSFSHSLQPRADTGPVVRPGEWRDYYIIHLDRPADYRHADGRVEEISEIREDSENREVLSVPLPASTSV